MEHATQLELDSLRKRARVEVNFPEPGFRGSWHTGTVMREVSKKTNKISVRFDSLFTSGKHKKKLVEEVDFICVRPIPPREAARSFKLDDDVDANHSDGWWEGVITAVHPPPPVSGGSQTSTATATYSVYFRATREQINFMESELRLHREWVYGKWVPPLEDQAIDSVQMNDEATSSSSKNEP